MNTTILTESYGKGEEKTPLIEQTIGDCFDAMAEREPDREALVSRHEGRRLTYRELQRQANRLASALLRQGLAPGDRIGIWSHNNVAWVLMQIATAKAGLILVNINPAYRAAEVEYALNKVGCKALVTIPRFKTSEYLTMLRQLGAAKLPELKNIWWIDRDGDADEAGFGIPLARFSTLLAGGDADDPRLAQVRQTLKATDPINIQFTSGTTGFPKGATLTHRGILNSGFFTGENMLLTPEDRLCIPIPLYHCFGMVLGNLACFTHGSTVVYPSETFDPLATLETVQAEKCTGLHGVPTMFIAELNHPRFAEFDLATLRTSLMAGAPCPIEVMKRVISDMHVSEMTNGYGLTEASPGVCGNPIGTPLDKLVSTVGKPVQHVEVKVIDPVSGATVAPGVTGELCTRGYSVMQGYWGDEARTRETIDAEGWMRTGDLATMDEDGYFNIVGRTGDMVIRGGENIYPREIEEFLYRHPKIQDVQVVGVPDPKYGEELCAWVIAKPGQTMSEDEVRAFCQGQIAHYKVPRYIRIVDAFPMTVTGKIQKFRIRQIMAEQLGLKAARTV